MTYGTKRNQKHGKQPAPKPVGNNLRDGCRNPGQKKHRTTVLVLPALEKYVKDIITTFKSDDRVLMWDLYNEPGNGNKSDSSLNLLKKTFSQAKGCSNPSQTHHRRIMEMG